MNADGSNLQQLTYNTAEDTYPAWSPDGTHIAFVSNLHDNRPDHPENREIYVIDANETNPTGTTPTRLTYNTVEDTTPAWSPDGTRIAFVSNAKLYVMDVMFIQGHINGGTPKPLPTPEKLSGIAYPSWSPDSGQIVFGAKEGNDYEIYRINDDGTGLMPLTINEKIDDTAPDWSPSTSSDQIVFVSTQSDGNRTFNVIDSSGNQLFQITDILPDDYWPAWSSDGMDIIFARGIGDKREIYKININDKVLTQLTNDTYDDKMPDW